MNAASSVPTRSPRLHSLDALRGLDMLIILGLDALILLLASKNPENGFLQEAARQMTHARWEGLHLYDLVFPVFVFISGASMSFSLAKYTGTSIAPGLFHLWKRAFGLAFLGLLVNGTLTWTESMRYASVLGLIGFSCAIAGTCILLCRRTGAVASAAGFILVLITLLQFTCGNFTPDGSVNSWVDRHWLPGRRVRLRPVHGRMDSGKVFERKPAPPHAPLHGNGRSGPSPFLHRQDAGRHLPHH